VWNFIANGSGGCDWGALELAIAHVGVAPADVPALVERVLVIKAHRPPERREADAASARLDSSTMNE